MDHPEDLTAFLLPPHVDALVQAILQIVPFHKKELLKTLTLLQKEELAELDNYLVYSKEQGRSIEFMAESYKTIMSSVIMETMYFQEHKKYRYSRFAEVADSVYYNEEYMSQYMHGVLISLFFWPNHLKLYRFFCTTLPKNKTGDYLEIGPGHGYFFKAAVEQSNYQRFFGIDLSETSIQQTKNLLDITHPEQSNIHLYCSDFFAYPFQEQSFDAIVMGEVLEHVENPQDFLKKIALLAKKDAYIFVTTCLFAPIIDHIYEFHDLGEIETLFLECGLKIKESCILPYVDKTLEECLKQLLTINVGYVLEKR
ncbi:class I SAM-dependent methyltransferase [Legionella shakespearei]|uniref:3-demethylubiquinone-9 3-methyltransferase n=1 Tax=Legionella shakespearei DSM 23087 TaxID=1122169 RepID=A0A0W0YVH1_9GAMM|nr:class I SAM-dependent methyltransferase [Legionella shakespearei]KTD60703.1 3-demethylubiquinone-9 3-methyltransferase [Legionella shakespearei DSM 23087]